MFTKMLTVQTTHSKRQDHYHNCQQNGGADDPPVIHVYVLSPAPRTVKHISGNQPHF